MPPMLESAFCIFPRADSLSWAIQFLTLEIFFIATLSELGTSVNGWSLLPNHETACNVAVLSAIFKMGVLMGEAETSQITQ